MRDGQERAELHRKIGTLNSGNFIEKLGGSEIARTVVAKATKPYKMVYKRFVPEQYS